MTQYLAKKQMMEGQSKASNEKTLWHGTTPAGAQFIMSEGFTRNYAGKSKHFKITALNIIYTSKIIRYYLVFFKTPNQQYVIETTVLILKSTSTEIFCIGGLSSFIVLLPQTKVPPYNCYPKKGFPAIRSPIITNGLLNVLFDVICSQTE